MQACSSPRSPHRAGYTVVDRRDRPTCLVCRPWRRRRMRGTKGDDAADILLNPLVAGDSAERSAEPAPGRVANQHDARIGGGIDARSASCHGTLNGGLGCSDIPREGWAFGLRVPGHKAEVGEAARDVEPVCASNRNHGDGGDASALQSCRQPDFLRQPIGGHVVDLIVSKPWQDDEWGHVVASQHYLGSGRRLALEAACPKFRDLHLAALLDAGSQHFQFLHACTQASWRRWLRHSTLAMPHCCCCCCYSAGKEGAALD